MNGIQLPCPPPVVNSYLGDVVETLSIVAAASCRGNGIEKETIRQQHHPRETQIRNGGSFSFSAFFAGADQIPHPFACEPLVKRIRRCPEKKKEKKNRLFAIGQNSFNQCSTE